MNAFPDERVGRAWYLRALRDYWWLILALVVVAVLVARAYSARAETRYEASADLLVSPVTTGDETWIGIDVLRETADGDTVVTAARLITRPPVVERVRRRLALTEDRSTLLERVDVDPRSQSNTVTIVGKDETPEGAARIANTFADAIVAHRKEQFQRDLERVVARLSQRLERFPPAERELSTEARRILDRLGELRPLVGEPDPTLRIASRAVTPSSPVWPRPRLSMAVAALAALLLGLAAAVGLAFANPYVRREDELLLEHGIPILGRVPHVGRRALREHLRGARPLPAKVMEAFRRLRATLAVAGPGGRMPATVLVTSPERDDANAATAVNLASALALGGSRVVLVDADVRWPSIASTIAADGPRRAGLARVLAGEAQLEDTVLTAPGHGGRLAIVPSNPGDTALVDAFQPDSVARVIRELQVRADVIVFNAAPLPEAAEGVTLASAVEAVLVTVRLRRTRNHSLSDLRAILAQLGITPVGVVLVARQWLLGRAYRSAAFAPAQRPEPAADLPTPVTRAQARDAP